MEARARGVDEAILLDHNGTVSEGSGENIFVVQDGEIATPPQSSSVLAGITRDSVIKIARDEGISIVERPVSRAELYTADEVFFSGTAAEITPIIQIDGRNIGQNTEGKVTAVLSRIYARAVTGVIEKYRGWLTEVYP
jgi:branched-chain amino acid aminotransferase